VFLSDDIGKGLRTILAVQSGRHTRKWVLNQKNGRYKMSSKTSPLYLVLDNKKSLYFED
jgi:hypothetical protein